MVYILSLWLWGEIINYWSKLMSSTVLCCLAFNLDDSNKMSFGHNDESNRWKRCICRYAELEFALQI